MQSDNLSLVSLAHNPWKPHERFQLCSAGHLVVGCLPAACKPHEAG